MVDYSYGYPQQYGQQYGYPQQDPLLGTRSPQQGSLLDGDFTEQPQWMRFSPMGQQSQGQRGGGGSGVNGGSLLKNYNTISNLFGGGDGGGSSGLSGLTNLFGGGAGGGVASSSALDGMAGGSGVASSSALDGMAGGAGGLLGGGEGAGAGGLMDSAGSALGGVGSLFAALIGMGKNTEANHPNTVLGNGLLAGLGPSISQVIKDPIGMGLPTALGASFLTPFTASKESKATKPEWSGLFKFGF